MARPRRRFQREPGRTDDVIQVRCADFRQPASEQTLVAPDWVSGSPDAVSSRNALLTQVYIKVPQVHDVAVLELPDTHVTESHLAAVVPIYSSRLTF